MGKILLVILLYFLPALAICQGTTKNPKDVNFHEVKQQDPFYPAGDQALYTYIFNNIKYSDSAKVKLVEGNVMVSFDVQPDSTLSNIIVLSGVGYGIDEEVVRLLKPLKYAPGIMNGTKVKMNTIITVPVRAH
jgi:outer membrane biosynthesis protein TonB